MYVEQIIPFFIIQNFFIICNCMFVANIFHKYYIVYKTCRQSGRSYYIVNTQIIISLVCKRILPIPQKPSASSKLLGPSQSRIIIFLTFVITVFLKLHYLLLPVLNFMHIKSCLIISFILVRFIMLFYEILCFEYNQHSTTD